MNLSPHFTREEFEKDGAMPENVVASYQSLSVSLLEIIRAHFEEPLVVTSGYRSPAANAAARGVAHSQHEATSEFCAADFQIESIAQDMRPVFDFVRASDSLMWDQVILEHDKAVGRDVVHISWTRERGRRMALEGETNNLSAYTHFDVTPLATSA